MEVDRDYSGLWWLPGASEDEKVPGILRFEAGVVRLKVLGWLGPEEDRRGTSWTLPTTYPAILGESTDGLFTLWNSVLTKYQDPRWAFPPRSASLRHQTFEASRLLCGEHRVDPDEAFVNAVSVKFAHLDDFAMGLASPEDDDFTYYTKRARPRGATILFFGGPTSSSSPTESTRQVFHSVEVHATQPLTLSEFEFKWLRPIQSFLSIAVDEHARFLHQRILYPRDPRDPRSRSTEVITSGLDLEAPTDQQYSWDLLIALRDGRLEPMLRRWFEIDRLEAHALANLSMLRSKHSGFTSNRLMNVASGLEGIQRAIGPEISSDAEIARKRRYIGRQLDRDDQPWFYKATQHAADPAFQERMQALITSVPAISSWLLGPDSEWPSRLKAERNGTAHALQEQFLKRADVRYLHFLVEVSQAIGVARLLTDLGYSEATVLERFKRSRRVRFAREQWHQLLGVKPPTDQ